MTDNAPLIERAFSLDVREGTSDVVVEGILPPYLTGTAYWNGPGRFVRGAFQYRHWLDGDGLVCALAFDGDRPRITTRFVRTEKFVREEAAMRPLFRQFGTAFEGDSLKRGISLESPANISVYPVGDALLAFGEQGLPWKLDPRTLETQGLFTFNGQLNDVTPFSAHPKIDHRTGELFNFGVAFAPDQPTLHLFRFDHRGALCYRRRIPLPYPASIHDFAISETSIIVYVSPLVLDVAALIGGGAALIDALRWQPDLGSWLMVVSRETGTLTAALPIGHNYCLHLVNAYECREGLVVDVVELERPIYDQYQVIPELFSNVPRGAPVRFVVDVANGRIVNRRSLAYSCAPDFPAHDLTLSGRAYAEFWMLGIGATGRPGRKFFDQLVRCNWDDDSVDVYQSPPLHYLGGEPLFLPDPGAPRRGVVICQTFDAEQQESGFGIFDAFQISRGPVASLKIQRPIPLLFHSSYLPR